MKVTPYKSEITVNGRKYIDLGKKWIDGTPMLTSECGKWHLAQSNYDKVSWRNKQIRKITLTRIKKPIQFAKVIKWNDLIIRFI